MRKTELTKTDSEDIEDVLLIVEKSLDIKFEDYELVDVKTYGELSERILKKIDKTNQEDCTSQQAFYKLREAMSSVLKIDKENIHPKSKLVEIIPKKKRIQIVNEIENVLGFEIRILRPKRWITASLTIILLSSLTTFFFDWKTALIGLTLSIFGFKLAYRFGRTLDIKTINEVVQKMTRDNYNNSRRNKKTFNRIEIETIINRIFSEHLRIPQSEVTMDALIERK